MTDAIAGVASRGAAAHFHACTHTTFSPNLAHGGVKTNVDPRPGRDRRGHPHVAGRDTPRPSPPTCGRALGDELCRRVEVSSLGDADATASPADTPLWSAMEAAARRHYPDCELVPGMIVGLTDARFFRAAARSPTARG